MRYLLILAMLAQTPKSLPTPMATYSIGFLAQNATRKYPAWYVDCNGAKECYAMQVKQQEKVIFQIRDGDGPAGVGGPCDLGKLVRAVKRHLEDIEADESGINLARLDGTSPKDHLANLKAELARCSPDLKGGKR